MKTFVLVASILVTSKMIGVAQPNKPLVDSLKRIKSMPYICESMGSNIAELECGDPFFWNLVKQKQNIILTLIEMLSDTTAVDVYVPNFGGQYAVGDVAYVALQEIIHGIPTFILLGKKFDTDGCGYCTYWNTIRIYKYRIKFQRAVNEWYRVNQHNLNWVISNDFEICDCRGDHPNQGHFELKK